MKSWAKTFTLGGTTPDLPTFAENFGPEKYLVEYFELSQLSACKYLVIDLESTGLDIKRDEITELACREVEFQRPLNEKTWSTLVRTKKPIPEKIQKLTCITQADVAGGAELTDVLRYLLENFRDHVWVAQCGFEFDFPLLQEQSRGLLREAVEIKCLDTKLLHAFLYNDLDETFSTNYLAAKYNVDRTQFPRHRAAGDVDLVTQIFLSIAAEYRARKIDCIKIEKPLCIRKFIPPPLP